MARTKRKSRDDLKAMGDLVEYIPRQNWEYDLIDGALKPLDALASEMELRWGRGKLQKLVSPETAAKFQSAKHKLDVAISSDGSGEVIKRVEIMMRGWQALEKEAIDRGHRPMPPDIWLAAAPEEFGKPAIEIAIVKDNADASLAKDHVRVYTLVEVARIIRSLDENSRAAVQAVKNNFPAAEIVDVREIADDPLPF